MTHEQNLKAIKEACWASNPESYGCIKSLYSCGTIPCTNQEHFRPLRLADVLYTLRKATGESYAVEGTLGAILEWGNNANNEWAYYEPAGMDRPCWNLLNDNLDNQSPETIAFIASLLTNQSKE